MARLLCIYMAIWLNLSSQATSDKVVGSLLFSRIKQVGAFTSDWIIINKFTLNDIMEFATHLTQLVSTEQSRLANISKLVYDFESSSSYPEIRIRHDNLQDMKQRLASIEEMINDHSQLIVEATRKRRNVFGNIISYLTGLALQDDVNIVESKMGEIEGKQENIRHVLKSLISFVDLTTEHQKASVKRINDIIVYTKNLSTAFNHLQFTAERISYLNTADRLISKLEDGILELQILMRNKFSVLSQIINGKLDVRYVSPTQLKDLLSEIHSKLPAGKTLPEDANKFEFYYSHIKTELDNGQVIIRIPIIDKDSLFDLFEISSIPMLSDEIENAHIFTRPDIDYLGINLNSKQFFTLNQQNFENCALSTYHTA